MNLPAVTPNDLLDQSIAPQERSALWSQVVVRAIVEKAAEPLWFPAESRSEGRVQAAS